MNYMIKIITVIIVLTINNITLAQENTPQSFVNKVAQKIISIVTSPESTDIQKKSSIKSLINKNFDVRWMSKFVLGRNYKALSTKDQQEYTKLYLNYLVGNYFPILMKYDNDKFSVTHVKKISKNSYDVDTIINRVDKPTVSIKYHVKDFDSSFKAVDMIVEGISLLSAKQAELRKRIARSGVDQVTLELASIGK